MGAVARSHGGNAECWVTVGCDRVDVGRVDFGHGGRVNGARDAWINRGREEEEVPSDRDQDRTSGQVRSLTSNQDHPMAEVSFDLEGASVCDRIWPCRSASHVLESLVYYSSRSLFY